MREPDRRPGIAGVHLGATVRAVDEPPGRRANRGGKPRFEAAEARNGMPETVPYSWRACWDGSRRARQAADILADMEARARQGSGGGR